MPRHAVQAAPGAPRIIACGGGRPQVGPIYLVNGVLVEASAGRRAAELPGAQVEVVPDSLLLRRYGSRGQQGVILVSFEAPHAEAR